MVHSLYSEYSSYHNIVSTDYEVVFPYLSYGNNVSKSIHKYPSKVFYLFYAFNLSFYLSLTNNDRLLHTLTSKYLAKEIVDIFYSRDKKDCFYFGQINSELTSKVAVSLCQGLEGLLILNNQLYYIEPLNLQAVNVSHFKKAHGLSKIKKAVLYDSKIIQHLLNKTRMLRFQKNKSNKTKFKRQNNQSLPLKLAIFIDLKLMEVLSDSPIKADSKEKVIKYVLIMINAVQSFFIHPSLGRKVWLHLVHLEFWLNNIKTSSGDEYLHSFCFWLSHLKRGMLSIAWDVGILLTGEDLFENDQNIQGISLQNSLCSPYPCILSEAFYFEHIVTLVHEIGHVLGLGHDGLDNPCEKKNHIMAAQANFQDQWSSCSADELEYYITIGKMDCIFIFKNINTTYDFTNLEPLPGQMFPLDIQCKLKFGYSALAFKDEPVNCLANKCFVDNRIYLNFKPLEGTTCNFDSWCINQKCIKWGIQYSPVDGIWTEWTSTACQQSCYQYSVAIKIQYRLCMNPPPQYGGNPCKGEFYKVQFCDNPSEVCKTCLPIKEYVNRWCTIHKNTDNAVNLLGSGTTLFNVLNRECLIGCFEYADKVRVIEHFLPTGLECSTTSEKKYCITGSCVKIINKAPKQVCSSYTGSKEFKRNKNSVSPILFIKTYIVLWVPTFVI